MVHVEWKSDKQLEDYRAPSSTPAASTRPSTSDRALPLRFGDGHTSFVCGDRVHVSPARMNHVTRLVPSADALR